MWRRKYVIGFHFSDGTDSYLEVEHNDMFEMREDAVKLSSAKKATSWTATSLFPENTFEEVVSQMKKEYQEDGRPNIQGTYRDYV